MINILICKQNHNIISIKVSGHSGYSVAGNDIVCSAVSTIMQATANGLTELVRVHPKITIKDDIPLMEIDITNIADDNSAQYDKVQLLMQNATLNLKDIAKSYMKYIDIKEKGND